LRREPARAAITAAGAGDAPRAGRREALLASTTTSYAMEFLNETLLTCKGVRQISQAGRYETTEFPQIPHETEK
jgi:hypothetical protein